MRGKQSESGFTALCPRLRGAFPGLARGSKIPTFQGQCPRNAEETRVHEATRLLTSTQIAVSLPRSHKPAATTSEGMNRLETHHELDKRLALLVRIIMMPDCPLQILSRKRCFKPQTADPKAVPSLWPLRVQYNEVKGKSKDN